MPPGLKLAIIGDPHIAVPYGNNDTRIEVDPGRKLHGLSVELLRETIRQVNAEPEVDAALILGDMTRDSEEFNHEVALELVSQLTMPYYIVIGNHDKHSRRKPGVEYPGVHRLDRYEFCQYYRDRGLPDGMARYVAELPGDVVLVVLDSNRTLQELASTDEALARQDDGQIGVVQLRWLDDVLGQIRSGGGIPLVAVHHSICDQSPAERKGHPLHFVFGFWQADDSAAARAVLAKHRVPLVLSGHLHAQSIGIQDGVVNLITAASVSYPHAWRTVEFRGGRIEIMSHCVESVPSCPNLQERSRVWLAEGMGQLIETKAAKIPGMKNFKRDLNRLVTRSGWWPKFCDGTQAGFRIDKAAIPRGNAISGAVFRRVERLLNEFGEWKSGLPDPNNLTLPVDP